MIMRVGLSVFGAWALLAASHAVAADPEVRSIKAVRPIYPPSARDAGHQGTVMVTATIQTDGTVVDAKVSESSGSALLDAAARDAVAQWQFNPPVDAKGAPRARPFDYELPFYKLPLLNPNQALVTFPCRDFVADIAWFEATFPGKPRDEVRDYQAFLAPILFRTTSGAQPMTMESAIAGGKAIKAKRAALDAAFITCKAAPDMLLIDAIAKAETPTVPAEAAARP